MNTPVSFELAKLLKEKGFDEPCSHAYKEVESPVLYVHQDKKYNNSFKKEWQNTVRKNSQMDNATINRYSAPTIVEVVMWLYDKYGIWIEVRKHTKNGLRCFSPYINNRPVKEDVFFNDYDSPTEAYIEAVEYVLTKLI